MSEWVTALILGLIEGLTEFIPVSSTGHLVLAKEAMGLGDPRWNSFIVMIQLGAILAVVVLYFGRLWRVVRTLPTEAESRRFAVSVFIAFIPSAVLGLAISGGLMLGLSKPAAAEFSFFLAIPTMMAAFVLDAWETRDALNPDFLGVL